MPTIREIQSTIERNESRMKECERAACDHEQLARELRTERTQLKIENAELLQRIHNQATQTAASEAVEMAKTAASQIADDRTAAQADRVEAANLRRELADKIALLDKKLAEAEELTPKEEPSEDAN